jgi:hypothetical protein
MQLKPSRLKKYRAIPGRGEGRDEYLAPFTAQNAMLRWSLLEGHSPHFHRPE